MAEDFSTWPTKLEARKLLGGVPDRTFDRWIADDNITVAYRKTVGRRPVPVVDPKGVALLKQKMVTAAKADARALARKDVRPLPARREIVAPQWRLLLTVDQAAAYTGLTPGGIRRLIRGGNVKALRDGEGYKVSRKALRRAIEALTE
jgi:excisionase family DNA binding protein